MTGFNESFDKLILIEGGYADDPNDAGGKTKYGITEAVARANGYPGDMKDLSQDNARVIYRMQYWNTLQLDKVSAMAPTVADRLFDIAVNCGVGTAAQLLQRSLNAFNHQGKDYPDMAVDGVIGPMSIDALHTFLRMRGLEGERVLTAALKALQGSRYITLAERIPVDEDFVYGWILKRVA